MTGLSLGLSIRDVVPRSISANVSKFTNPREPGEARRSWFPAFHKLTLSQPAGPDARSAAPRELIVICWIMKRDPTSRIQPSRPTTPSLPEAP